MSATVVITLWFLQKNDRTRLCCKNNGAKIKGFVSKNAPGDSDSVAENEPEYKPWHIDWFIHHRSKKMFVLQKRDILTWMLLQKFWNGWKAAKSSPKSTATTSWKASWRNSGNCTFSRLDSGLYKEQDGTDSYAFTHRNSCWFIEAVEKTSVAFFYFSSSSRRSP